MAGPLAAVAAGGRTGLPLVAFIGVTFVVPLATMLLRSVYDPVVAGALPDTVALLREWDGESDPGEAVYAAAARELVQARQERTIGRVASRTEYVAESPSSSESAAGTNDSPTWSSSRSTTVSAADTHS